MAGQIAYRVAEKGDIKTVYVEGTSFEGTIVEIQDGVFRASISGIKSNNFFSEQKALEWLVRELHEFGSM